MDGKSALTSLYPRSDFSAPWKGSVMSLFTTLRSNAARAGVAFLLLAATSALIQAQPEGAAQTD